MKMIGYSVYDSKAQAFSTPVFQKTEGLAIRSFEAAVTHPDSEWSKNPEDYSLFETAEFDDSNGSVADRVPTQIITGLEAVRNVEMKERKLLDLHAEIDDLKVGGTD